MRAILSGAVMLETQEPNMDDIHFIIKEKDVVINDELPLISSK
jgi:hypothetical protein